MVDSPDVNAFALPGGYVYITRGLMVYLNSEAELAGVVGHEIGHVTARHGVRQQSMSTAVGLGAILGSMLVPGLDNQAGASLLQTLSSAWVSGYGRDHELEADRLGAEYIAKTGYNPQAMVEVIGVLKNQELFDAELAKKEGRAAATIPWHIRYSPQQRCTTETGGGGGQQVPGGKSTRRSRSVSAAHGRRIFRK